MIDTNSPLDTTHTKPDNQVQTDQFVDDEAAQSTPEIVTPKPTVVWQPNQANMTMGSSRKVAYEKKKLLRQTLLLIFLLIVFSIVFIVIIFPNAPRLITFFIPEADHGSGDSIPPQPPVIYSVPVATSSAGLSLAGVAEPASIVKILNNDVEIDQQTAAEDGSFTFQVELINDLNVLTALATDESGNVSRPSRQYQVVFDNQVPSISVSEELLNGLSIEGKDKRRYTLEGSTEPLAKVLILDRFVFADSEGVFRFPFDLNEGENLIQMTAVDKAGNEASLVVTITYRP